MAYPYLLHRTNAGPWVIETRPLGIWFTASNLCPETAKRLQPVSAPVENRQRGEPGVFRKPGIEAAQILAATATQSWRRCGL